MNCRRSSRRTAAGLPAVLLAAAGVWSGHGASAENIVATAPEPSPQARWYLQQALGIMERHSINRERIDWPRFRASVLERARGARSPADTHPLLREALRELGDGHSLLITARPPDAGAGNFRWRERNPWFSREPQAQLLDGRIGYLSVPGFFRGSHADQQEFAARLHEHAARLEQQGACGWIVDLRGNAGGNLWPMLTGIGPVLGDGEVAAAVYPDGERIPVWYQDGRAGFGDYVQLRVQGDPVRLSGPHRAVAVLLSPATASSGETIAIAFRGRPESRSFGETTRGVSTGNRSFALSDGAVMALTVAHTADRNGRIYAGAVEPEEAVSLGSADDALIMQPAVQAATAWLVTRMACDGGGSGV